MVQLIQKLFHFQHTFEFCSPVPEGLGGAGNGLSEGALTPRSTSFSHSCATSGNEESWIQIEQSLCENSWFNF